VLGVSRRARLSPPPLPVTYEALPFAEVAGRGGEHVHATDGDIGQVRGLVIDPGSHQVIHVLLREGHVFGRMEVAIPIGAVTGVGEDGIRLNITKQQVQGLPPGTSITPAGKGAQTVRVTDGSDVRRSVHNPVTTGRGL
jgi:uncharacterized protein YrrD